MSAETHAPQIPPPPLDFIGAILSYLVPGLGQISQGRYAKGLMFLVCLYSLFFYGMYLGKFQNVYLPDYHPDEKKSSLNRLSQDIYARFQFIGQFPIGMAVWPAIYQYRVYDPNAQKVPFNGFMRAPSLEEINDLQRNSDKTFDLAWVYTVIAGVLNVLVIYDALAGPAFREPKKASLAGGI